MIIPISFAGKTILVTGAGRGLGKSTVAALLKNGGHVIALSRTEQNLRQLTEEFPAVVPLLADVNNFQETKDAIKSVGRIDMLVNNAGVNTKGTMLEAKAEDFYKMFNTNTLSALNIFQAVAQGMVDRNISGSIVNIGSLSIRKPTKKQGLYASSKAALDTMTKFMALELGQNNIRVNSICPGLFPSDMSKVTVTNPKNPIMKDVMERSCLRRVGSPEEVTNVILFFLSDYSSYVTGESLYVSGGL